MLRRTFIALAAVAALAGPAPASAAPRPQEQISTYLAAREKLGQFNGVLLAMKDGKVIFERAYGWASVEQNVRNTPRTRFNVASITKQFTAAAILQLRDAGKLSLADPICRFIDPCPEAWKPVTVKHLLNHTSGVPDYESALELGSDEYTAFITRHDNVDRILKGVAEKPLDFAPGTKWNYSNTGYILLARIIAKVSGETYSHYVETHLLAPAGMTSSSMDNGLAQHGVADGYAAGEGLSLAQTALGRPFENLGLVHRWPGDLSGDHGDAALWSTAGDLARWVTALNAGRIVSAASLAEMQDGGEYGYGYGLEVSTAGGRLRIRHTGQTNGFISVLQWYPNDHVVLIALSNYENGRTSQTMRDLAAVMFGQPYDLPRSHRLVTTDAAAYQPLLGEYEFDGDPARLKVSDGMLLLEVPGQFTAGLLPEEGGTFYVPFLEGVARMAPNGRDLIVHSRGMDRPLTRKS
jgi:CubicO group peptidase (beta-lactamase class C family)